jgi:AcrR family transcriptional regulator
MTEGRRTYDSPLRQQQALQTRELIVDALTGLLEDRRTDEVTTKELARAAGVSERTVYRHFPDRLALVEALSARLEDKAGGAPGAPQTWDDLRSLAVSLMAMLEANHVEARAEALLNADPRRYSDETREHTARFRDVLAVTAPELDDGQQRAFAAVLRVLLSAQSWLRMREEHAIPGEASGPILVWAIDALLREVRDGHLPPPAP